MVILMGCRRAGVPRISLMLRLRCGVFRWPRAARCVGLSWWPVIRRRVIRRWRRRVIYRPWMIRRPSVRPPTISRSHICWPPRRMLLRRPIMPCHIRPSLVGATQPHSTCMWPLILHNLMGGRRIPRSRPGRSSVFHRPMLPLRALSKPGSPLVVMPPIGVHRKRHNRNSKRGCVGIERHIAALIRKRDIRGVQPAPRTLKSNITPAPVIETTHYLDGRVGIELRDLRI